jgi:hypothetical protein
MYKFRKERLELLKKVAPNKEFDVNNLTQLTPEQKKLMENWK